MLVLRSSLLSADLCAIPVHICLTQGFRGNLREEENYQILRNVSLRYELHTPCLAFSPLLLLYKLNLTVAREWITGETALYEDPIGHPQLLGFCLRGKLLQT